MLTSILFPDGNNETKALYLTASELKRVEKTGYVIVDGSSLNFRPINDSDAMLKLTSKIEDDSQKEITGVLEDIILEKRELSDYAKKASAGVMYNQPGLTAIFVQNSEDYKRFTPGYEAPTNIAMGYHNRSASTRIPYFTGSGANLENRIPVPLGNQYAKEIGLFYFALDGVENNMEFPKLSSENLYKSKEQIPQVPTTLSKAIKQIPKKLYKDLGFRNYRHFISMTREQAEEILNTYSEKLIVGPEVEFFLIDMKSGRRVDKGVYCDTKLHPVIEKIMEKGLEIGLPYTKVHHEVASGQYEIGLNHASAIETADNINKHLANIWSVSRENGFLPDYSAKPFKNMNGNGMHMHFSIWKGGKNLFA